MSNTLVIILSETRASELTFNSFKKNVLDELNADLCVCIGVKPDYDYNNPFYALAKYKFTYDEPDDFGDAFEYAYNILSQTKPKYECLENINALYGKLKTPKECTDNITFYENMPNLEECDEDKIVVHTNKFSDILWKNQVYGIKSYDLDNNLISQENVITYKKQLYWREFLKIKDHLFGGVKDIQNQHPGSAGILIFFRWFLLKNLIDNDLLNKYDRFIITRSDFMYQMPHPKVELMDENKIWIPDCEHYMGYTDRHVVLSKNNIVPYLNIFNNFVNRSNEYFNKMKTKGDWNLEQLIIFHLKQNNIDHLVKEYPYIMYSVRNINGSTRWTGGNFSNEHGYYIKYFGEYDKSSYYKKQFEKSGLTIDDFYKNLECFSKLSLEKITKHKCQSILYNEYIPLIGIGVGGYDYNITYASVTKALKIGYRLIDTAESYHNEEAVGDAIIDSGIDRKEIIIISKYFGGINYGNPNDVMNSFTKSLNKLKTNYIDIYLVHFPFGCKWGNGWEPYNYSTFINYKQRISVWLQLIELKKQKLVNYIGISNWTIDNINELKINKLCMPDIIQIEWCPSFYNKELYNYCFDNHIKIIGYGLFSRNSINDIDCLELNNNKKSSEILIKWCVQKKIIVIPRSNNYENLLNNYNIVNKELWNLCDKDIERIDNIQQKLKGHFLENVYKNNNYINLWKPIILNYNIDFDDYDKDNLLCELINGNISCIIINNLIIENDCKCIINRMEEKNLLKDQLPYNNYDINFRNNEIGITIDHLWRNDPIRYFNECSKVNKLFDTIFDDNLNPFEILFETVKKIAGNKYNISQHQQDNILCPKGIFKILDITSEPFPYHTDGFNYGDVINNITYIDRNLYPTIMNCNTNSIVAIILILQQTEDIKNEIDLYNCLVNDLEGYKDEIGMYSHWMGTKYSNDHILKIKLEDKQLYSPILNTGDLYIFSASRIHKLNNLIKNKNRIVLATFGCIKDNDIILYQ
jgi:diketogulonate reductase-like aldo/keto reductase